MKRLALAIVCTMLGCALPASEGNQQAEAQSSEDIYKDVAYTSITEVYRHYDGTPDEVKVTLIPFHRDAAKPGLQKEALVLGGCTSGSSDYGFGTKLEDPVGAMICFYEPSTLYYGTSTPVDLRNYCELYGLSGCLHKWAWSTYDAPANQNNISSICPGYKNNSRLLSHWSGLGPVHTRDLTPWTHCEPPTAVEKNAYQLNLYAPNP